MQANSEIKIWEGVFASFGEAQREAIGPGFAGEVWIARSLDGAKTCLTALAAGTLIPPLYKQRSTMLPPVAAMLLDKRDRLSIVDFGGGLGIGYMTLLESIPSAARRIDYTVVEGEGVCATGRSLFAKTEGSMRFATTYPEGARHDLIHCSSMLQYVPDWKAFLKFLGTIEAPYLLLSDVFAGPNPTFATLQNYYGSRIEHWFLNYADLLAALDEAGYVLEMKSDVVARRLGADDALPMSHFPPTHRLAYTLHLLLKRRA